MWKCFISIYWYITSVLIWCTANFPQSAVHAGQVKVPPGYHPIDVEKEWGRLHVAILERERLLRIEFERWGTLCSLSFVVALSRGHCECNGCVMEWLILTRIGQSASSKTDITSAIITHNEGHSRLIRAAWEGSISTRSQCDSKMYLDT